MPAIPESVRKAWDDRNGATVLTTVDKDGVPNSIYASSVSMFGDDKIVVANNYFDKTMKNIESGSSASILFITSEKKSYQLKGALEYFSEGEIFDDMKKMESGEASRSWSGSGTCRQHLFGGREDPLRHNLI
jgi:predicted pyridoxine 5'-phosphate oxidase superfamily flavin-nucleotide-binding protein